ncbi:MAG: flagellar biosynthesis anti-sigma factor FlgM [Clostridia bacterium]|nr:flagellar biosynthesis anti-sigma factor FlgM [Clostridia bacterium]
MEIKNISGILNTYNKMKLNGNKAKTAPEVKKTDKIEFNFARSVEAAKSDLAVSVNEDMAAEKIGAVSGAVNSGTYDISPEAIADAILMF